MTKRDTKREPRTSAKPKDARGAVKDLDAKRDAAQVRGGIPPKTTSTNGGGEY